MARYLVTLPYQVILPNNAQNPLDTFTRIVSP